MEQTIDEEVQLDVIDDSPIEPSTPLTKGGLEDRVEELSVQTEDNDETIRTKIMSEDSTIASRVREGADPSLAIEEAVAHKYTEDEVEARFNDINAANGQLRVSNDDLIEQNLLVEGAFGAAETQYYSNINFAETYILEHLRKNIEDTSFAGKAFDFVDRFFIRQIPIGAFEDVTKKNTAKSEELLNNAVLLPLEEYKTYLKAYVDEMSQQGVFTSDNLFAMQQAYENARGAGYNPEENVDAVLGAVDLGTLGFGVISKLGKVGKLAKLAKAKTALQKVAAVKGTDEAGNVAGAVAVKNPQGVNQLDDVVPSVVSYNKTDVKPNNARVRKIVEENEIIKEVKRVVDSNAVGRIASVDEIAVLASKTAARIQKTVDRPVRDISVSNSDIIDQNIVTVFLGKPKTGDLYKTKASAQKVSKNIPNSEVVPNGSGFEIKVQERLVVEGVFDELDLSPVYFPVAEQVHRIVGSSANRDNVKLDALSKMGESSTLSLLRAAEPSIKTYSKLSAKDQFGVNAVLRDLRDGPDSATRDYYTDLEFASKFEEKTGRTPNAKVLEGYHAAIEVSDAAYLIDANNMLSKFTNLGYVKVALNDHISVAGKQVNKGKIPVDELIYNAADDAPVKLEKISASTPIWISDRPLPSGQKYFTKPQEVSLLEASDVMGFNAGGRRTYGQANYYVTLGDDLITKTSKREKAVMYTATERQAKDAQRELSALADAQRTGSLTDEMVVANNTWNPAIESVAELKAFLKDKGLDLNRAVNSRPKDMRVTSIDENSPLFNESFGDYIKHDMSRTEEVLMEYGGKTIADDDPLSTITQQFASAANNLAMKAYSYRAANSWVAAAKKLGGEVELGKAPNPLIQMSEAIIKGNSPSSNRLRELRAITQRRLQVDGKATRDFKAFTNSITEPIIGKQVDITRAERGLLNVGFQSNFGFFAIDQFFMQSFHTAVISAMHPIHGSKAALEVIPMRMLLNTSSSEAYELGVKRFSKTFNYSVEETKEIAEYFYTSGRDIVAGDAIEQGTGIGRGLSGYAGESFLAGALDKGIKAGKKGLDLGLVPFNQGERLSRSTSVLTAIKLYKAEFPNKSILSQEAREWIVKKDGALTLNMTTQGRAMAQAGPMKIPTQWLSFSFRAMEAMAFGKDLTKQERLGLFTALVPMFGLTGFGATKFADQLSENLGIEPNSPLTKSIRYGMLDTVIKETTGLDTALASRLAPLTIIGDLNKKINDDPLLTTIGGPSGEITGDIANAVTNAISSLYNGWEGQLTQDVIRILRQPSGIDDAVKAYGVFNYGTLRSKNGVKFEGSLSTSDAVVQAFGFTPAKIVELQERRSEIYMNSKDFTTFRREIDKQAELGFSFIASTDVNEVERGRKILEETAIKIELSSLSPTQKNKVRSAMKKNNSLYFTMLKNYNEQHNFWAGERLEELLGE